MTARRSAAEYRVAALDAMSEAEFTVEVIARAQASGWHVYHARPARTERGWRTPGQGDAEGFPDLILARRGEMRAVELKSARGRTTPAQDAWLDATGGEVWRPGQWDQITEALR